MRADTIFCSAITTHNIIVKDLHLYNIRWFFVTHLTALLFTFTVERADTPTLLESIEYE